MDNAFIRLRYILYFSIHTLSNCFGKTKDKRHYKNCGLKVTTKGLDLEKSMACNDSNAAVFIIRLGPTGSEFCKPALAFFGEL